MPTPAEMVVRISDAAAAPGDFKAYVADNAVFLPRELVLPLRQQGIRSIEEILSYAKTFPTAIAMAMRWNLPDAIAAAARLEDQLYGARGKQQVHAEPAYGALAPDELPPSTTAKILSFRR